MNGRHLHTTSDGHYVWRGADCPCGLAALRNSVPTSATSPAELEAEQRIRLLQAGGRSTFRRRPAVAVR